jgi:formate-dependent nitrite reductase membrane component NrfD
MSEQGAIVHLAYDWMIVVYFFLGGVSAGAFMFSVAANYWWKQEFKPLSKRSAVLSLIALAIGMFMLLAHLGRPERAWRVFATFNPHSMLSWGVWFLNIFGLMNLIYTGLLLQGKEGSAKKFGYLGLPFAILTATYTAVHIARAPDMLLWHSKLMPVLFLNGAIISGIALVILFSASARNAHLVSKLGKLVSWMVILEISMVLAEVLMLLNGGTESIAVAQSLLSGKIGWLFVGVEIVMGAVVPAAILLRAKPNAFLQVVASVLILMGIFTMRYIVIVGGQLIS